MKINEISNQINNLESTATEAAQVLEALDAGAKMKDCVAKINEIINVINDLHKLTTNLASNPQPQRGKGVRDYGPESTRKMTELDAWRIMHGDLIGVAVKDIADTYGLSRGQVYSVRGGYTFTKVGPSSFDMIDVEAFLTNRKREDIEAKIDAKTK